MRDSAAEHNIWILGIGGFIAYGRNRKIALPRFMGSRDLATQIVGLRVLVWRPGKQGQVIGEEASTMQRPPMQAAFSTIDH